MQSVCESLGQNFSEDNSNFGDSCSSWFPFGFWICRRYRSKSKMLPGRLYWKGFPMDCKSRDVLICRYLKESLSEDDGLSWRLEARVLPGRSGIRSWRKVILSIWNNYLIPYCFEMTLSKRSQYTVVYGGHKRVTDLWDCYSQLYTTVVFKRRRTTEVDLVSVILEEDTDDDRDDDSFTKRLLLSWLKKNSCQSRDSL